MHEWFYARNYSRIFFLMNLSKQRSKLLKIWIRTEFTHCVYFARLSTNYFRQLIKTKHCTKTLNTLMTYLCHLAKWIFKFSMCYQIRKRPQEYLQLTKVCFRCNRPYKGTNFKIPLALVLFKYSIARRTFSDSATSMRARKFILE